MFYIGITLEKELFRVAIIKKDKGKLLLESTHTLTPGPECVKLFYNLPPFHTGKSVEICSGLDSQDLLIRKLHLPLSNKEKISKTLPFQLESILPSSEEPPLVCTQLKFLNKQMTSITLIATTEPKLQTHLNRLKEFNIEPDRVSCAPAALVRFAAWKFPEEATLLCLDVRGGIVTSVVMDKGEILLSQTLCIETDSMAFEKLALFLKQKGVVNETTPWVLTGELKEQEALQKLFLGKQLICPSTEFSIATGFGLDAALGDESSIQFCQKHLLPAHTLQKRKKQILTYTACCLGSALIMGLCSLILLNKKENLLARELKTHLPSLQNTASIEEVKEGIITWETTLKGNKNTFALIPNVPRVSDLLAYLSTHPTLSTEEGNRKEGTEIESIHYSLVKYPSIADPSSPYVARVELNLNTSTPRVARDFHEALLKGDQIVNPKKEIKWQTHGQTYHTSFELNKGMIP